MTPPAPAAAQPRVLVVRTDRDDPASARGLAERLGEGLTRRGIEVELPVRPPAAHDPRSAVAEARRAYHDLRPSDALRALEAWLERAESTGGAGLDRAAWVDGLLWIALARRALDDLEGADAALDRALAADPELVLDPADYPPPFRERAEARRAAVLEAGAATLRVTVEPEDARVRVDGSAVERADREARLELPVGTHLVHAAAPGHRPAGRVVEVPAQGAVVALALEPDPTFASNEAGAPGGEVPEVLREAARASGRALAILDARSTAEGWRLALRDEASRRTVRAGPEPGVEPAVRALLAAWDATLEPEATEPDAPATGEDPWPWVAVGAGAAVVAAVAVGLAVALGGGASGWSGELVPVR